MEPVVERLVAALQLADPREELAAIVGDERLAVLFPELPALAMPDGAGRHKDVLAHSIEVCAKTPPRLRVRLAALLHDVGKPATRRFDGGEVTFRNHEAVGAKLLRGRLPQLGFARELVDGVATIVAMSGRFKEFDDGEGGWTDAAVRRYARDAGEVLDDLLVLCEVDVTSKHLWKHDRQRDQVARLRARIAEVAAADARAAERPDLDGGQVMAHLGLAPGPQVGAALKMLLAARRERGGPLDTGEAYRLLDDWWARQ